MKRKYFGTDGVRAAYGSQTMNEAFAWRLGAAAARLVKARTQIPGATVVIGRDTRGSGPSLEVALAAGLAAEGVRSLSLGVVPSPVVSLLTRREGAALGVVITASHNPASDNGIKFFGPAGIKLTDEEEVLIEALLPEVAGAPLRASVPVKADALNAYLELTSRLLPRDSLRGWKIVLDVAHGAAVASSPRVLTALGADLVLIGNAPDGTNINDGVGSQHPEKMCAAVKAHGARLGIAHDGDADRCILADERGEVLDGDEILTLLALDALKHGRLPNNTLVVTMQSNLGVDAAVQAAGGRVCRTDIGDRYVIERMITEGAALGGESSGHVICSEVSPTGDGLVAALKVIAVMQATGEPLSQLRQALRKFPLTSIALQVREKKPLDSLPTLSVVMRVLQEELGSSGRLLVRYSGTESKLRLLVEGPTTEIVESAMTRLVVAANRDLEIL